MSVTVSHFNMTAIFNDMCVFINGVEWFDQNLISKRTAAETDFTILEKQINIWTQINKPALHTQHFNCLNEHWRSKGDCSACQWSGQGRNDMFTHGIRDWMRCKQIIRVWCAYSRDNRPAFTIYHLSDTPGSHRIIWRWVCFIASQSNTATRGLGTLGVLVSTIWTTLT